MKLLGWALLAISSALGLVAAMFLAESLVASAKPSMRPSTVAQAKSDSAAASPTPAKPAAPPSLHQPQSDVMPVQFVVPELPTPAKTPLVESPPQPRLGQFQVDPGDTQETDIPVAEQNILKNAIDVEKSKDPGGDGESSPTMTKGGLPVPVKEDIYRPFPDALGSSPANDTDELSTGAQNAPATKQASEQAADANPATPKTSQNPAAQDNVLSQEEAIEALTEASEANGRAAPGGGSVNPPLPKTAPTTRLKLAGDPEGDHHLSGTIQDEDLRLLLQQLSVQTGMNILAGPSVEGTVSAVLNDVDVFEALDAILKSRGYIWRREGKFIYVGTTADMAMMKISQETVGTRIYRPNYVNAKELQNLVTPLLTVGIGKTSITTPAAVGISPDPNGAGGNSFADGEALLVQDYESTLTEIDQVVREIDRRPLQVSIEAMILSVKLNDQTKLGVDFQVLRNEQNVRLGWGSPRQAPLAGGGNIDPVTGAPIGEFKFDTGGLKFAFLDDSLGAFINALETIGDTNVIATPRLLCLNKQKAEILIGGQFGYVSTTITETSASQNVEFLEVGVQLRLRPYISNDGMIRMEVHPELSTGQVKVQEGFTLPEKLLTQVTTDIMCRDGATMIIGGLMREDLQEATTQVPVMGSLPVVGPLFRTRNDTIERNEIMVLVTPRIVYDESYGPQSESEKSDFMRRERVVEQEMSMMSRIALAERYLQRGTQAWNRGDIVSARRLARLAVHFDPTNRAAVLGWFDGYDPLDVATPPVDLSTPILLEEVAPLSEPIDAGDKSQSKPEHPLTGDVVSPWLLDDLEGRSPTNVSVKSAKTKSPNTSAR